MKPEFAAEAVDSAIEKSRANIAAIKALPTGGLDYENCVLAFDSATEPLDTVYARLGHLVSVADSDALRAAYGALVGKIADFYSSVRLDDGLYAKLAEYAASPEGKSLEGARARMLSETLLDFELGGAKLPAEGKRRIREIDGAARAEGAEIFRKRARRHQALHPPHRRPVQARRAPARGRGGRRAKGGRAGGIRLGFHARTALLRPVHVLRRRRFPARKALASLGASGVRRRIFQLGAHGGNFEAARGKGADSRARGFCGSRPRAAHGAQRGEGARVR